TNRGSRGSTVRALAQPCDGGWSRSVRQDVHEIGNTRIDGVKDGHRIEAEHEYDDGERRQREPFAAVEVVTFELVLPAHVEFAKMDLLNGQEVIRRSNDHP